MLRRAPAPQAGASASSATSASEGRVRLYSQEGWFVCCFAIYTSGLRRCCLLHNTSQHLAAARPLPQTPSSIWRKHRLANKRRTRWPNSTMAAAAGAQQQGAADLRLNLLAGQKHRQYDRRDPVPAGTKVATDWHLELRDRIRRASICTGARLPTWRKRSSRTPTTCARSPTGSG